MIGRLSRQIIGALASLNSHRIHPVRVAWLAVTVAVLMPLSTAHAVQDLPGPIVSAVTQYDLDRDGLPDRTDIRCDFAGGNDLVQVYDGARDMQASVDWQQTTDFEDDTWVFDAWGDGQADLVIDFHHDGEALVADLYDDRDGDGRVSYSTADRRVLITEPRGPTVHIVASDGWWQQDEKINYNLYLEIDGPVRASFNSPVVWWQDTSPEGLRSMADADPDVTVLVRDVDNDGRPDYDLRQVLSTQAVQTNYGTEFTVNARDREVPIKDFLFWPYLGGLTDYIKPIGGSMPPIQMDWGAARISVVGEFVASRSGDSNWFVYSLKRFGVGDDVYANFENPFAFYDLANDLDGIPELAARSEYFGPFDVRFLGGAFSAPVESIRYSWDQDNDGAWDFKVDLTGRHLITEVVTFPDLAVQTVQYDAFPNWIVDHRWDTAVFVAVEGLSYVSSEGIYEGYVRAWRDSYVTGQTNSPDMEQVQDAREGLRLEYTPELGGQARLYISSIDHKLHLRNAQGGVWNLDGYRRLRYSDLDGDGYLDQWRVTSQLSDETSADDVASEESPTEDLPEEAVMSLHLAAGMLIYADSGQVHLIRSMVEPSLFEAPPPRDHEEWLVLGEQLDRHAMDSAPDGFLEMASQFQGPTTQIEGATLTDFRLIKDGFRFVLELHPGFQVIENTDRLDLNELPDGPYLVSYDGEFAVQPLTPPRLIAPPGGIVIEPPVLRQGEWATIRVVVSNSGLQDATSVPISVYAVHKEGEPYLLLGEEELFVPGEGEGVLEFPWWPVEAGQWNLSIVVDPNAQTSNDYRVGQMADLAVQVEPANLPSMFHPVEPYNQASFTWPVFTMLIAACVVALCVLWLILNRTWKTTGTGEGR